MKKIGSNLYCDVTDNGKWALFKKVGQTYEQISKAKYDQIRRTAKSLFGDVGEYVVLFDNETGQEIINEYQCYTFISEVHSGIRLCKKHKWMGIMAENVVISPWYDEIRVEHACNVAVVDGIEFLTTRNGCKRISKEYKKISRFEKICALKKAFARVIDLNDKHGIIDVDGNEIIPCIYDNLHPFTRLFWIYETKNSGGKTVYGIISVNGEKITYEDYYSFRVIGDDALLKNAVGETHVFNLYGQRC